MNNTFYSKKKVKESDAALATNAALRFLSRREYSKLELYQKLCLRYTTDAAKAAVKKCVENDWLSESRYIEMLHRHIISQCYGPLRFVMEAKKKGINSSLYDEFLRDTDWTSVAVAFLSKKSRKMLIFPLKISRNILLLLPEGDFQTPYVLMLWKSILALLLICKRNLFFPAFSSVFFLPESLK